MKDECAPKEVGSRMTHSEGAQPIAEPERALLLQAPRPREQRRRPPARGRQALRPPAQPPLPELRLRELPPLEPPPALGQARVPAP
jgi:hypothetical protein